MNKSTVTLHTTGHKWTCVSCLTQITFTIVNQLELTSDSSAIVMMTSMTCSRILMEFGNNREIDQFLRCRIQCPNSKANVNVHRCERVYVSKCMSVKLIACVVYNFLLLSTHFAYHVI